jgi:excisionase family DNA binding protein
MSAYAPALPEATAAVDVKRPSGLARDEVMTAREVADLLKMPVSTGIQLARRGALPASRLGRTWRFLRPRLEELLGADSLKRAESPAYAACSGFSDSNERSKPASSIATGGASSPSGGAR